MTGRARPADADPAGSADRPGRHTGPGATPRACWVVCAQEDVPPGDDWLGQAERSVLARFRVAKKRNDFRVGRWAAKQALARCLVERGLAWPAAEIQVIAAADGAPEPRIADVQGSASVSLSHSGERGFAVACAPALPIGCDLERIEPRSPEFVRDYFTAAEAAQVAAAPANARPRLATLLWSAKESALKLRREGLRADTRSVAVRFGADPAGARHGRFSAVAEGGGVPLRGCWWLAGEYVCTVAAAVSRDPPEWSEPDASGVWTLAIG